MKLAMRRVVLFTKNMPAMVAFYRDVPGSPLTADEKGSKEFEAGRWRRDVGAPSRSRRGARLGKVMSGSQLIRKTGMRHNNSPGTAQMR